MSARCRSDVGGKYQSKLGVAALYKTGFAMMLLIIVMALSGCATMRVDEYIKADPRYTRQMTQKIDNVYAAVKTVLARHGWTIATIEDPVVYERNQYTEHVNQKRMLLMTDIVERSVFVDAMYEHLNVYLYEVGDGTDIDIRYESVRSMVKDFHNFKNDRLINGILDEIEKEL